MKLIGVGAGEGEKILLNRSTSDRLTELFQKAARRLKVEASTRGKGIHDDEVADNLGDLLAMLGAPGNRRTS